MAVQTGRRYRFRPNWRRVAGIGVSLARSHHHKEDPLKYLLAVAAAMAVALAAPAAASATDPEPDHKVTICHHPPGNPDNVQTLEIDVSALLPHLLLHGDTIGECTEPPESPGGLVVEEEPPGENCEAGGIKVILDPRAARLPDVEPPDRPGRPRGGAAAPTRPTRCSSSATASTVRTELLVLPDRLVPLDLLALTACPVCPVCPVLPDSSR